MQYRTVNGEVKTEFEIQHSLFICHLKGVESAEEALRYVESVSKKYSSATHNCYAFLLRRGEQKCSDDGEPQGTAGLPIKQVLINNGLTNVVAVVTRYFGGIKLGAGGLVGAYTKSVGDAVSIAEIVVKKESALGEITLEYNVYPVYVSMLSDIKGKIIKVEYDNKVKLRFAVPIELIKTVFEKTSAITSGKLIPVWDTKMQFIAY